MVSYLPFSGALVQLFRINCSLHLGNLNCTTYCSAVKEVLHGSMYAFVSIYVCQGSLARNLIGIQKTYIRRQLIAIENYRVVVFFLSSTAVKLSTHGNDYFLYI